MNKQFLIVLPGDKLAGAEKVLNIISNEMYHQGFEVTVIIWYVDKDKTCQWDPFKDKFNIVEIEDSSFAGIIKLRNVIKRLTHEKKIDFILSSNITINSLLGIFRKLGILRTQKLIVREPSSPFLRYQSKKKILKYKLLYYLGYLFNDLVIFQTTSMKEAFEQNMYLKLNSIVIPNPIEYDNIFHLAEIKLEKKLGFKEDFIVAAGRFIHEKGFDMLIRSFNNITDKNIKLLILGSGPLEESLRKIVNDLNLTNRVVFHGFVKNPINYFKLAKLCVISSRIEGFPNTLLQMLTVNNKVITTRCCGDLDNIPGIKIVDFSEENISYAIDQMLVKRDWEMSMRINVDQYLKNRNTNKYIQTIFNKLENGRL